MAKFGIDQDSLIELFANASAKQSEQLREAVSRATLSALQGRELTLKNIRAALQAVTQAANTGLAKNPVADIDMQSVLDSAVTGMDEALLKAVDANRVALQQFVDQGVGLQEKQLKKALDDLEKFEDTLIASVKKSTEGVSAPLAGQWAQVLEKLQVKGTMSGAEASNAAEQLASQMQSAVRESRAAGLKAAQALAQSYSALVSGVLIGMSDALRESGSSSPKQRKK